MPQRRMIGPPDIQPVGGGRYVGPPQIGPAPASTGFNGGTGSPFSVTPNPGGQYTGPPSITPGGGPSMDGGPLISPESAAGAPGMVGPPNIAPAPGALPPVGDGKYVGPPSIAPGGKFVGPPDISPLGDSKFSGPPSISPLKGGAVPPSGGGKFVGPPDLAPGGKFVGPPSIQPMGGPSPLASAPSGANAGVQAGADTNPALNLPRGTPLQREGYWPTGEAPTMGAPGDQYTGPPNTQQTGAPGTTPQNLIQQYMGNTNPALIQKMLQMQEADLQRAQQEQARGAIEYGDQTRNPVMYARLYRQYVKQGFSPDQAAERANMEMAPGKRDRQGRLLYDVVERLHDEFSQPEYLQKVLGNTAFWDSQGIPIQGGGGQQGGGSNGQIPPSNDQGYPAPYPNQGPVNEVGQDPLSIGLNEGIMDLLGSGGGSTTQFGQGTEQFLMDTLGRAGQLDQGIVNQRLETAQEGLDRLEQNRIKQLQASLAARGLLGQGSEVTGLENVARDIASIGAGQYRDILASEQEAANQRFQNVLGLSTGLTAQQPQNLLGAVNAGTNRQNVLAQIALQNLAQQQDFNKFLAMFGLERDKTLAQIEQGRYDALLPLLQIYNSLVGQARQGYI